MKLVVGLMVLLAGLGMVYMAYKGDASAVATTLGKATAKKGA